MDDQRFDEFIKSKLANYEQPGFEPSDLSTLHTRLDAMVTRPRYHRYGYSILTLSGLAVCTVIVLLYLRRHQQALSDTEHRYELLLANQRNEIKLLQKTVDGLRLSAPDTVWITVERKEDLSSVMLLDRIASLEQRMSEMNVSRYTLSDENTFGDSLYTVYRPSSRKRLSGQARAVSGMRATPNHTTSGNTTIHEKDLSAHAIRDMERHYRPGIGITVGPTVELSKGFYPQAEGTINGSVGVLADLIVSPSLSVETGLKHVRRYYEVDELNETTLPDVDESLGEFEVAEIDTWAMEIPLNLKYRYPLNARTYWLAGLGYSSLFYYRQVFEYDYHLPQGNGFTIGSVYEDNKVRAYPGTLNASLGVNRLLRNGKILELSLYYQHGLGAVGLEGVTPRYFGMRGVYWFRVK